MKHTIELSRSQTEEIIIEANSEAEAIALAIIGKQDWRVEAVNDKMFMGFDEGTDEPIFDDDDYYTCPDTGIMELAKNVEPERLQG